MKDHIEFLIEYVNRKRKEPGHIGTFNYLEIGCDLDPVFSQIDATYKVGVDPVKGGNFRGTSDAYFATLTHHSHKVFDLIFIDGDHESSQVAKDIDNSLNHLSLTGLLVLHDVLPPSAAYTSSVYCNDAWRAFLSLWKPSYALDIDVALIPHDFGVGLVRWENVGKEKNGFEIREPAKVTYDEYISEYVPKMRMLSWEEALEW